MLRNLFAFWRDVVAYRPDADARTLAAAGLMAIADAVGVTETTPLHDQLVRERIQDAAEKRAALCGDEDLAEWDREVSHR